MPKYTVTALGGALAALLCATPALAQSASQQPQNLPPVEVQQKHQKPAKAIKKPAQNQEPAGASATPASAEAAYEKKGLTAPLAGGTIQGETLKSEAAGNADTASMLRAVPGVNVYGAGGVSSLPDIHGFNDDRINTTLNGMTITAACANHMNPVLSFADPSNVKKIDVIAGVSPVSAGGDSLGSVVAVETVQPVFASGDEVISHGSITGFAHSNGGAVGGNVSLYSATSNAAISYTGSTVRSNDYVDGHGDKVESTMYEATNQALSLAWRGNGELLIVDAGIQKIPYQGFPNQWMDMTNNQAWYVNTRYQTKFDWGKLDLQAYFQNTRHEMNFLADKEEGRIDSTPKPRMPYMPMDTDGQNMGYKVKAEIPVSASDMLRVGNDLHGQLYNEWWPAVAGSSAMMCCDTFWNINGGKRFDVGTFAEIGIQMAEPLDDACRRPQRYGLDEYRGCRRLQHHDVRRRCHQIQSPGSCQDRRQFRRHGGGPLRAGCNQHL